MWLYYVLKTISNIISALPYKFVVRLGRGCGKLYWYIAKKQRIRAEETMQEHLGISAEEAQKHVFHLNIYYTTKFCKEE